jgi:hypothetical protein
VAEIEPCCFTVVFAHGNSEATHNPAVLLAGPRCTFSVNFFAYFHA